MKIAISGVPGVGKSSVAKILAQKLNMGIINISEFVVEKNLILDKDVRRDSFIVDVDRLCEELEKLDDVVIDGHLSHYCKADFVFVLRCKPEILKQRLLSRKWSEEKIRENVEAEILDVVTQEAVAVGINSNVYEIDTTDKGPVEIADIILSIIKGEKNKSYKPGSVNWKEEFEQLVKESVKEGMDDG